MRQQSSERDGIVINSAAHLEGSTHGGSEQQSRQLRLESVKPE